MFSKKVQFGAMAAGALMVASIPVSQATADEVADFYRGKQLTIQVGFSPGGGYDLTARTYARHIGKHIPGNPSVIVQNVPGAGTLKLANALYNVAPKDGSVLGVITTSVMLMPLYGKRKVRFDTSKFNIIGSFDKDNVSCAVWKGAGQGIKTLQDLINAKEPVVFGSSRPTSNLSMFPMFMKNVLGANVKVVNGYRGSKPAVLAMQSGELHGSCVFYGASLKGPYSDLNKSGNLDVFVQLTEEKSDPIFGNATPIFAALKTDDQRAMAKLLFAPSHVTRPFVAPPGVPKARVDALRKALLDTAKDPELIADAAKLKFSFSPISGGDVEKLFAEFYKTPRALIDKTYELTVVTDKK